MFVRHHATIHPLFGIFLRYFLSRLLWRFSLSKDSELSPSKEILLTLSHQSNHHLRIFLCYFLKQLVALPPITRWIREVSGVRIIFSYTVDVQTGSNKLKHLSHLLDY